MRSFSHACLLALTCAISLLSEGSLYADDQPPTDKLGKKIDNAVFKDTDGKPFALKDLKDKKAVVVVFLSFDCPVSNSYAETLTSLARDYGKREVAFLAVSANEDEDPAQLAEHAREWKIPFPVFQDDKHAAADAFKATITPEAFVLDWNFVLRYRGRIDNGYAARLKKNNQVTCHDLREALDDLLAGKPVREPATRAIGCPMQKDAASRPATGKVTFYRDVLPILQNNCQTCHRPGEVGPFSLMSYKQAVNWAADIKDYTQARKMPPWKPVEGPPFHNERKLSDTDIATLAAWVDGGAPAGDRKDSPPPPRFSPGWQAGQPDLVLEVNDEFQVGASGPDVFRCFVLPTNFPEDKYVTAVEVRPGNPRVVHHALVFLDSSSQARKLQKEEQERQKDALDKDLGPGYSVAMGVGFIPTGGLGGWAPGQRTRHLPEGAGYYLPKGADVVIQIHYHRDGRVEKDRSKVGLYLAKKPVTRRYQTVTIAGRFISIPAGDEHYRVSGGLWVRQDCDLHSVMPHMHMLGREVKITMVPPDGPAQTLVAINDWEYNWQETYFFKEPIHVQANTRFDIEAFYDNSAKNPNNPNSPPKPVYFGQQTTDEMCFGFLGVTSNKPGRIKVDRGKKDAKKAEVPKKP